MDFSQMRLQQQDNARKMLYQNSGYQFERRDKKTLILDIEDTASSSPLSKATEFSASLFEPLIVDKLSDVYLDNFSTFHSLLCDTNDRSAFSLSINEFNLSSNVASTSSNKHMFNRILIPNENNSITNVHSSVIHKGKKMNYICSVNPGKISTITGKITDLSGNSMFTTGTGTDGGILYYLHLSSAITADIPSGTSFTFSSPSGSYITAFYMKSGSTDLYFYSNGGAALSTDSFDTETPTIIFSDDVPGVEGTPSSTAATLRIGDYPRFIAEFVIVARD